MHPETEPKVTPKADYPFPSSTSTTPDKEGLSVNVDKSVKDAKGSPNELPPNMTNSSTMTCPEWQYPNWPSHYVHPFQYQYSGVLCCPPPMRVCSTGCTCSYQNYSPNVHYNSIGTTQSGISVGASNHSQSNTKSTHDRDHMYTANHSYCQTLPYIYPSLYAPNHMWLQSPLGAPIILAPGHEVPPNEMGNATHHHPRLPFCFNCSNEILPTVDECNAEEIPCRMPLKIISFTDSVGRTWQCVGTKATKVSNAKGKEKSENVLPARSGRHFSVNENSTKKSTIRTTVTCPCRERPLTAYDISDFPQKKKKTKVRVRKFIDGVNPCLGTIHLPPSRSLQTNTSNIIKPVRTVNYMCINTSLARRSTSHINKTCKKSLREAASVDNVKNCQKSESKEMLLREKSCSQKPAVSVPAEEQTHDQVDPEWSTGRELSPAGVSLGNKKLHKMPSSRDTTVPGRSGTGEANTKNDEPADKASCNDFLKRSGVRKDTPAVKALASSLEDEEFWSSSSSSGTYDDSEAFDSCKLLNNAQLESLRQNRQSSRDRLFRRRVGLIKFSNTRSEEDVRKKRRSLSPTANDKDERPKEQVIIDTSKVRITEETPKRFIVESKDGACTSQKGMTITVQAEIPRGISTEVREICNTGGQQAGQATGVSCSCEVSQPQWQAPPCPGNEVHSTALHCHHHTSPAGRTPARQISPQEPHHRITNTSRIEHNSGENERTHDIEDYHRIPRRTNIQNFNFPLPWGQRNADRPREENRHQNYVPPFPSTERFDSIRRDNGGPTNRTRRWYTQSELPLGDIRGGPHPEDSVRIQIPNSYPRHRPYEYIRNHTEETTDNQEGMEENREDRNRNTIDINIYRNGGVQRLGTVRRVIRCNSPRTRGPSSEDATQPDDDPDSNLDFYRRPRSAITVSKTNYVSPRNRQLEEEVQRIQNDNCGNDLPSTSSAKNEEDDEETEYPNKHSDEDQEFEDGEKPDCEYEEVNENKRDEEKHCGIEDED